MTRAVYMQGNQAYPLAAYPFTQCPVPAPPQPSRVLLSLPTSQPYISTHPPIPVRCTLSMHTINHRPRYTPPLVPTPCPLRQVPLHHRPRPPFPHYLVTHRPR